MLGPGKSYIRAASTGSVAGLWNGRVVITNGIPEINHNDARGAGSAHDVASGRTTIGTAVGNSGRLELAGDLADDSITSSDRIFVTGRSAQFDAAASHIRNLHGVNTLSGPIECKTSPTPPRSLSKRATTARAPPTRSRSPAALLSAPAGTNSLVLRGNGIGSVTGNILNGTVATQSWDVRKLDAGTWTIAGAGNNYTGVTHVGLGTLKIAATGSIASYLRFRSIAALH